LGIAGTIAIKDSVIGNNGELAINLPDGYYSGKTATASDTDLIADNIKSGINIFGIDGDSNVADTSSGDAAAGDILSGKIAWVDGAEVTGTYSAAGYTWTKAGAGSWEGVNENLDWVQGVGNASWWPARLILIAARRPPAPIMGPCRPWPAIPGRREAGTAPTIIPLSIIRRCKIMK